MENRNLQWNKRVKVPLILIFSVNTNHESVAYRSFSPSTFEARGARKVTTGIEVRCNVQDGERCSSDYSALLQSQARSNQPRSSPSSPPQHLGRRGATHLDAGNSR